MLRKNYENDAPFFDEFTSISNLDEYEAMQLYKSN